MISLETHDRLLSRLTGDFNGQKSSRLGCGFRLAIRFPVCCHSRQPSQLIADATRYRQFLVGFVVLVGSSFRSNLIA